MLMSLETEMRNEMRRLEKEIAKIDEDLERLHGKIVKLVMIRKKKDRDLRILKANFGEEVEDEMQTPLAKLLEGNV